MEVFESCDVPFGCTVFLLNLNGLTLAAEYYQ